MAGNLELDTLQQDVAAGAIDTVLVCFTDMQGRLLGKRVTGHFFVDQVVDEMHACDYLLALDMEMSRSRATPRRPGISATATSPYAQTSRPCAGFPGSRAPRWC